MMSINSIKAIQVLDSRGLPTVSCKVILSCGIEASAIVPSGASTGTKEALELRDGDSAFMGKGVIKAVNNINNLISPLLKNLNPEDQELIDKKLIDLDGTDDKSNLGANAILAVSLAVSHVAAKKRNVSLHQHFHDVYSDITGLSVEPNLPMPMLNILNGGEHADNNIDIQEFMIIPFNASTFHEAMRWSSEIYWNLKNILKNKSLSTAVGDEGGFAPNLKSNEEALTLILDAIKHSGLVPGKDVFLALDCAASEFFDGRKYNLKGEGRSLSSSEFVSYLEELAEKYPIISIEDGMDENDFDGWKELTDRIGHKCQLVGDDLFVTNKNIFKTGIEQGLANSILIKFNQIGTITETIETIHLANSNNYKSIISHRSGETEDTTIADLAIGLGAGQIKTGAPCRSDRVAKYNRILWIEEENNNFSFPE
ncbi:phosphopyruvate hydratase [Gammaproteobacteria bacterium]|nr:phosphopyruvate hydratase [Gammaproteobacteria bacterium]MDA8982594.1 phosphopyruvate hydratase [Gammaproteobacteria bacterium]MDA9143293.1 phosphopyruvate hydratase [Gammaproteobacteria bacterium]